MTDFEKIKKYYASFDEKGRLENDNSGKLEFYMTMRAMKKFLPKTAVILDLGGAAGIYTFALAKLGYKVYLADLSETLIEQAKNRLSQESAENIMSCDIVNAIDLSIYENEKFDVVILFGPLYHLTDEFERQLCVKEINRVLKKNGLVFASFIPHLSGSIAIVDRYFAHPDQVNKYNLIEVFNNGKWHNATNKGFQEGYYPSSDEIITLFKNNNFDKINMFSIRGVGYNKEDSIYAIKDKSMFNEIIKLIEKTSELNEIIDMCGHAMYIGKKI